MAQRRVYSIREANQREVAHHTGLPQRWNGIDRVPARREHRRHTARPIHLQRKHLHHQHGNRCRHLPAPCVGNHRAGFLCRAAAEHHGLCLDIRLFARGTNSRGTHRVPQLQSVGERTSTDQRQLGPQGVAHLGERHRDYSTHLDQCRPKHQQRGGPAERELHRSRTYQHQPERRMEQGVPETAIRELGHSPEQMDVYLRAHRCRGQQCLGGHHLFAHQEF